MPHDGYKLTIIGLLRKRDELLLRYEAKRDELASTQNDIIAIERTLDALGHRGELNQPRGRILKEIRRQLSRFVCDELRKDGPLTTRDLAERLAKAEGRDLGDKKLMAGLTARVSKCMTGLVDRKQVERSRTEGIRCYYALTVNGMDDEKRSR